MPKLKAGDAIRVPCDVKPGPFAGEFLIQVDTVEGPVSGFVVEENLIRRGDDSFVKGVVLEVLASTVKVKIKGSFFTTNGLATVSEQMALAA
jgi:hypothetical protein